MEFGNRAPGQTYQPRPGSYEVILGELQRRGGGQDTGLFLAGRRALPGEVARDHAGQRSSGGVRV